ncbi:hypothetical protein QYM36_000375 [Artemia franciscana]|uniref:Uncharacterized protein n=1 Tax=Artemia franciscana TaxID=6661 RepID=A0AA88LGC6_ARTSF|nr:hypothetical protein QYM36_000375 [Artemia franciscana]
MDVEPSATLVAAIEPSAALKTFQAEPPSTLIAEAEISVVVPANLIYELEIRPSTSKKESRMPDRSIPYLSCATKPNI